MFGKVGLPVGSPLAAEHMRECRGLESKFFPHLEFQIYITESFRMGIFFNFIFGLYYLTLYFSSRKNTLKHQGLQFPLKRKKKKCIVIFILLWIVG